MPADQNKKIAENPADYVSQRQFLAPKRSNLRERIILAKKQADERLLAFAQKSRQLVM